MNDLPDIDEENAKLKNEIQELPDIDEENAKLSASNDELPNIDVENARLSKTSEELPDINVENAKLSETNAGLYETNAELPDIEAENAKLTPTDQQQTTVNSEKNTPDTHWQEVEAKKNQPNLGDTITTLAAAAKEGVKGAWDVVSSVANPIAKLAGDVLQGSGNLTQHGLVMPNGIAIGDRGELGGNKLTPDELALRRRNNIGTIVGEKINAGLDAIFPNEPNDNPVTSAIQKVGQEIGGLVRFTLGNAATLGAAEYGPTWNADFDAYVKAGKSPTEAAMWADFGGITNAIFAMALKGVPVSHYVKKMFGWELPENLLKTAVEKAGTLAEKDVKAEITQILASQFLKNAATEAAVLGGVSAAQTGATGAIQQLGTTGEINAEELGKAMLESGAHGAITGAVMGALPAVPKITEARNGATEPIRNMQEAQAMVNRAKLTPEQESTLNMRIPEFTGEDTDMQGKVREKIVRKMTDEAVNGTPKDANGNEQTPLRERLNDPAEMKAEIMKTTEEVLFENNTTEIAKNVNTSTLGMKAAETAAKLASKMPRTADATECRIAGLIARENPDMDADRVWTVAEHLSAKGFDEKIILTKDRIEAIEKEMAENATETVPVEQPDGSLKTVSEMEAETAREERKAGIVQPTEEKAQGTAPGETLEMAKKPLDRSLEWTPVEGKDNVWHTPEFPDVEIGLEDAPAEAGTNADGTPRKRMMLDNLPNPDTLDDAGKMKLGKFLIEQKDLAEKMGIDDVVVSEDPEMARKYGELVDTYKNTVRDEKFKVRADGVVDVLKKSGLANEVVDTETDFNAKLAEFGDRGQKLIADGMTYGFTDGEKVYLNPKFFSTRRGLDTPIHEFGHLAIVATKQINRPLYDRALELIKQTDYWNELNDRERAPDYVDLVNEKKGQEALTRMIADRGQRLEATTPKGVIDELKKILVEIWKSFGNALGIRDLTPERVEKMSIEDIADAIRAEMTSGREFGTRELSLQEGDLKAKILRFAKYSKPTSKGAKEALEAAKKAWKGLNEEQKTALAQYGDTSILKTQDARTIANGVRMLREWDARRARISETVKAQMKKAPNEGQMKILTGSPKYYISEVTGDVTSPFAYAVDKGLPIPRKGDFGWDAWENLTDGMKYAEKSRLEKIIGGEHPKRGGMDTVLSDYAQWLGITWDEGARDFEHGRGIEDFLDDILKERDKFEQWRAGDRMTRAQEEAEAAKAKQSGMTDAEFAEEDAWVKAAEKNRIERERMGETDDLSDMPDFSRASFPNGRQYVRVDVDQSQFDGKSEIEQKRIAYRVIKEKFQGKIIGTSANKAFVNGHTAHEYTRPVKRISGELNEAKMRTSPELDNLLSTSRFIGNVKDDGHHPEAKGGWDNYETIFEVGGKYFTGTVKILVDGKGRRRFYDVTNIKEEPLSQVDGSTTQGHSASDSTPARLVLQGLTLPKGSSDAGSVAQNDGSGNGGQIANQTDSQQFKRWFGDSKIVDAEGKPLIVYHGSTWNPLTEKNGMAVFKTGQNETGAGAHFGTKQAAKERAEGNRNWNIGKYYLSIKNPLEVSDTGYWTPSDIVAEVRKTISDFPWLDDWNAIKAELQKRGYDGLKYENVVEDEGSTSYIAFEPTQIKSATDNIGTFDTANPDVRFSRGNSAMNGAARDEKYGYEALAAKSAMKVRQYGTVATKTKNVNGRKMIDTDDIVRQAVDSIRSKGTTTDGKPSVRMIDTGRDVVVDENSLRHARPLEIARFPDVFANYGDILANSIVVNEAVSTDPRRSTGEKVALGMAINRAGRPVFVRSVIDSRNGADRISDMEIVYAVDARKGDSASRPTPTWFSPGTDQSRAHANDGINPSTVWKGETEISIPQLLEMSKGVFGDIFSRDVNRALGLEREDTKLGNSLLYSRGGRAQFVAGRTRVATDAEHGELSPGGLASAKELAAVRNTPVSALGTRRFLSLPISDLEELRKMVSGDVRPAHVKKSLPDDLAATSTKKGKVAILSDTIGVVDRTDMEKEKATLKTHGFFRNENPSWCLGQSAAAVKAERIRSDEQLSRQLEALGDRRMKGLEAGGQTAERGVFADEVAKVVMGQERHVGGRLGRLQTIGKTVQNAVAAMPGMNAANAEWSARQFLDWSYGQPNYSQNMSGKDLTAEMFGKWLVMPQEVEARAPEWALAIEGTIAADRQLSDSFRTLADRRLNGDEYLFKRLRKQLDRQTEAALMKLNREANEPISAGSNWNELKESFLYGLHDTFAPVYVRMDTATKTKIKAMKAALRAAPPAARPALKQQIDLYLGDLGDRLNRLELARTAYERGGINESSVYYREMVRLENEATERWGLTTEDMSFYLDQMRVIETNGRSAANGEDVYQAHDALLEMQSRLGPEKWRRMQQYGNTFHAIHEKELLNDPRAEKMFGKAYIDYLKTQTHYVTTKRVHSQEELDAIDAARANARRVGVSGEDDVIGQMYAYGGANGAGRSIGEADWTAKQFGSMAAKRDARGATFEKVDRLQRALRRNQLVLDLREALTFADVKGVKDMPRIDGMQYPEGSRYGHLNYLENGQKRTLVVPRQIADAFNGNGNSANWYSKTARTIHNVWRSLIIDYNPAYWPMNVRRNQDSIEKNMPGMRETYVKTALRALHPGLGTMSDLVFQTVVRNIPASAKLFSDKTVFAYIPQMERICKIVERPGDWQQEYWKAEDAGDTAKLAQMDADWNMCREMMKANMFVSLGSTYRGEIAQTFAADALAKKGLKTIDELKRERAAKSGTRKFVEAVNFLKKNQAQQEHEDILAKGIAYLADRKHYGLVRTSQESGDLVNRRVSIAQGERRGAAAKTMKMMVPFFNMIEKGVVRHWDAYRTDPGHTLGADAKFFLGRASGLLMATGLAQMWMLKKCDGDEEKAKQKFGKFYEYAKDYHDAYRNCSEYVRKNYNFTPIWTQGYTSVIIGGALTDEEKLISPMVDFTVNTMAASEGLTQQPSFGSTILDSTVRAVVPDLQMTGPIIEGLRLAVVAATGENQTDLFRDAPMFDQKTLDMRYDSLEDFGEFSAAVGSRLWNYGGGRSIISMDVNGVDNGRGESPETLENVLRKIPWVSPAINRMVKIQVGSPEKYAKNIRANGRQINQVIDKCAARLLDKSEGQYGYHETNPEAYEQKIAEFAKTYGLDEYDQAVLRKKYLNGWIQRRCRKSFDQRLLLKTMQEGRRRGMSEAEIWIQLGER